MLHRTVHDVDLLASDAERGNLHLAFDALGVILIVQQHQYFASKELHIELEGFFGTPILEHQMGRQLLDMGHESSSPIESACTQSRADCAQGLLTMTSLWHIGKAVLHSKKISSSCGAPPDPLRYLSLTSENLDKRTRHSVFIHSRIPSAENTSIVVQAIRIAASIKARSATGPTQASANSF